MDILSLNVDKNIFSGKKIGNILILSFRKKPLLHITDLSVKDSLFDYLDLVASCDDIKVLLIKEAPTKMRYAEYIAFYRDMIRSEFNQMPLERMYNAVSQFVMKLVRLNKMVVHADSGDVIQLYMNIGFACDFRIVADNTVFQNPNIELGLVPKGGSTFFLSKMLGSVIASRILFSGRDIKASEAYQLGIVDKVVPLKNFDQATLETARSYAQIPTNYAVGVKKLLNYDIQKLDRFLEFENELLRNLVRSSKSQKKVA